MKAASPPEQDIGYQQAATLSLDGMTAVAIHSQPNIVDWQMPVMVAQEAVTASAQVVGDPQKVAAEYYQAIARIIVTQRSDYVPDGSIDGEADFT